MREFFRWVLETENDFNLNASILIGVLMLVCSLVGLFGTLTEFRRPRDYPRRWMRLAVGLYFFVGTVAFLVLLLQRSPDDPLLLLFVFVPVVFVTSVSLSTKLLEEDLKERGIDIRSDDDLKAKTKEMIRQYRRERSQRKGDRGQS